MPSERAGPRTDDDMATHQAGGKFMTRWKISDPGLGEVRLAPGKHRSPSRGLCLLEAVAYFAGERHSDHPRCVSPILGSFGRHLNDALPSDMRQRLAPLAPSLVGTAKDGADHARGYLALDWLVRSWLPAWLDLTPACLEVAHQLRTVAPVTSPSMAEPIGALLAAAHRSAATDAAASAAASWDLALRGADPGQAAAAWGAARQVARTSTTRSGWDAAHAAIADLTTSGPWAIVGDVAGQAAQAGAASAAWDAAAAGGWHAVEQDAQEALSSTVAALRESAIDLFTSMVVEPNRRYEAYREPAGRPEPIQVRRQLTMSR